VPCERATVQAGCAKLEDRDRVNAMLVRISRTRLIWINARRCRREKMRSFLPLPIECKERITHCHLGAYACQKLGPYDMVELKIALMIAMIAILFFAIYFTAIPG
jgi:hypothetical protein